MQNKILWAIILGLAVILVIILSTPTADHQEKQKLVALDTLHAQNILEDMKTIEQGDNIWFKDGRVVAVVRIFEDRLETTRRFGLLEQVDLTLKDAATVERIVKMSDSDSVVAAAARRYFKPQKFQ
ncbi:MAG: hypothetical protein NT120_00450 [Candidatus Aenigmarchaeota archaeon]|nr:hypothetical protein [Candidatus Aenigmarchaeota archaeon]